MIKINPLKPGLDMEYDSTIRIYKMMRTKQGYFGWILTLQLDEPGPDKVTVTLERYTNGYTPKGWRLWDYDTKRDLRLELDHGEALRLLCKFMVFSETIDITPGEYEKAYQRLLDVEDGQATLNVPGT
ncbi:MAG: hypothetical protein RBT32_07975 [Methanothermobacter sp.]|jgi:hypothetical protein|nr:hypothetical protein [Methanothermobacter sp.]